MRNQFAGWRQIVFPRGQGKHAAFGLLLVAYALLFSWLAVRRHETFHTGNDLAVFSQVVWNTTQGRPFETSLVAEATNFLGQHFSPILALFTPVYALWPDARLLLIAQAVIMALGAVPIYAYAGRRLGGTQWGLGVATAYLLFPAVHFVTLAEFHPIAFATPLLGFAAYALLVRRYRAFFLCFALAFLIKEEIGLILAGVGPFLILVRRRIRLGMALSAIGVLLTWLLLYVVIPGLARPGYGYTFAHRYDYLGENVTDIVVHLVAHPRMILPYVLIWPKALFLAQLLGPLALLPLLAPGTILLSAPTFGYLLLSDYPFQYSIQHQYTAPLIPFLFLATVDGLHRLRRWGQAQGHDWRTLGVGALLAATIVGYGLWSPAPLGGSYRPADYAVTEHVIVGHQMLARIPPQASVGSEWKFYPHLSNRRGLGDLLNPRFSPVDYVLVDRPPGAVSAPQYPHVLLPPAGTVPSYPLFEQVSGEDGYSLTRYVQDLPLDQPVDLLFGDAVRLVALGWLDGPSVRAGQSARLVFAWQATRQLDRRYVFFVHLLGRADRRATLVAQDDRELGGGTFPTTLWDEWGGDKLLADEYTLRIPEDLPPGDYDVATGVYPRDGGPPLLGANSQGRTLAAEVVIGVLHVRPASRAEDGN